MLACASVVFCSFCLTCYLCYSSRGFKRFSLWLASRFCSLCVDASESLVLADSFLVRSTRLDQACVVCVFPKRPQVWVTSKQLLEF